MPRKKLFTEEVLGNASGILSDFWLCLSLFLWETRLAAGFVWL